MRILIYIYWYTGILVYWYRVLACWHAGVLQYWCAMAIQSTYTYT
jgi:hypothetical protein